MIPVRNVTVSVWSSSGQPVADAQVVARLSCEEVYAGQVVRSDVSARTDAAGSAVLALFPNELGSRGSHYRVSIHAPGVAPATYTAVVPDRECTLHEIADLDAFPPAYWSTKADRVPAATAGHLAALDARGNLTDAGSSLADIVAGAGAFAVVNRFAELDTAQARADARANLELQYIDGGNF